MGSVVSKRFVAAVCVCALTACLGVGCDHVESPVEPPVEPVRWTLSGTVTEAGPQSPVKDARIEVLDGPGAGRFTTTDAQGRYTLIDLQEGTFSVRATADGLTPESRSITLAASLAIDFALRRPASPGADPPPPVHWTLSGLVRDAGTGMALDGAHVEVVDGTNKGKSAVTDESGRYFFGTLDQDTFSLRAEASQFESETHSVALTANLTSDFLLRRVAPPPPLGPIMFGRVINGLSEQGLGGANVRIDGVGEATSADDGAFRIPAGDAEQNRIVTITAAPTLDRVTRLRVPGPAPTLTLIPKSIDLPAFDELLRGNGGALHRWTIAPRVVVERRVLQFTNTDDIEFTATAQVMSDAEAHDLVADLTSILPQLTGGTFTAFGDAQVQLAAEGDRVGVTRPGWIVVARFEGLTAATTFWGYTRWAWNGAGEMEAAHVMLDRGFETSASPYEHSLHAHELGHALGYNHVTGRASVMNMASVIDVTAWDRDATRLAFLRRPLSQSPDTDPDPFTVNSRRSGQLFWSGAR